LFSSGKVETLGTELSETSCGGKICSARGGDTIGKEGFSNDADCCIWRFSQIDLWFSQCLGSKSATFEPASSRS